jgi:hypothetical protein
MSENEKPEGAQPEAAQPEAAQPAESPSGPFTFNEVLLDEMRKLRPKVEHFQTLHAEPFADPMHPSVEKQRRSSNLKEIYGHIYSLDKWDDESIAPLSALCLSGGGIRSATFNLGVIQALARIGVLDKFDYLSTVSGGGYIGGWLKAWMRRRGTRGVIDDLNERVPDNPLAPEPNAVDQLREYSNYLTPRKGLFSGDTWSAVATILRNLILNWLIIVPALGALCALFQLSYLLVAQTVPTEKTAIGLLGLALVLSLIASINIHRLRHVKTAMVADRDQGSISRRGLIPLLAAAFFLAMPLSAVRTVLLPWNQRLGFAILWCVVIPFIGWFVHELRRNRTQGGGILWGEALALTIADAVAAAMLFGLSGNAQTWLMQRPALYVLGAVPILLALYLVARTLFVAFSNVGVEFSADSRRGAIDDADREWWARFSGLVLLSMATWLAIGAVTLVGWSLGRHLLGKYLPSALAGVGGATGIITILFGASGDTGAKKNVDDNTSSPQKELALKLAAPVFCIAAAVILAHLTELFGRVITGSPDLLLVPRDFHEHVIRSVRVSTVLLFILVPVSGALLAGLMGFAVNINRFSLHGFYRNRLVRAYLGASNPDRKPDPFTGFDIADNMKLHDLWVESDDPAKDCRRPLSLINTTLNLVASKRKLAWQLRKAESFSMTPFYCGNFFEGYRKSEEYTGGITLGTALTISGAAANPNMGYNSSPSIGFLLTLFNARLGAWFGNTNHHGEKTFTHSGPRWALKPLIDELIGATTAQGPYINLSDGGHFENLGLYEMVLRRCRFVFLSDAGHDPDGGFEDLGNAIRKIRIDFGISIDFERKIHIVAREEQKESLYCAIGTIRYTDVDGNNAKNGTLLYIKPALYDGSDVPIPYDVFSYSRASTSFPHEPTSDQWFDESQFESYRALGSYVIERITQDYKKGTGSLPDMQMSLSRYMQAVMRDRQGDQVVSADSAPRATT